MKRWFCVCALLAAQATVNASPKLSTDNPLGFFTNVASRLLSSEMNLDLTRIQIFPTNQYTPAVHRLLQVTANLYDSTTTNFYPTIFRPLFSSDGTNVFINGYELVNASWDANTSYAFLAIPRDLNDTSTRSAIGSGPTRMNIYGMPWIIGAKKGLPNFNQIIMQSVAQTTRKLQVSKPSLNAPFSQYQFTQMYILGVSNTIGASLWNSYRTNYPGSVYAQADASLTMILTNDFGFSMSTSVWLSGVSSAINLASNQWQGAGWVPGALLPPNAQSFQIPLFTNFIFLPDSAYQQSPPAFVPSPISLAWSNAPGDFPQPRWGLSIANRLRCVIFDGGLPGRIIDYVQLSGPNSYRDLTGEIQTSTNATGFNGLWSTNQVNAFLSAMPLGNANQINVALGDYAASDADWQNFMLNALSGSARLAAIDSFRVFMRLSPIYFPNTVNTNLITLVPFTPTAKRYQPISLAANDPLVHYVASDLNDLVVANSVYVLIPPKSSVPNLLTNLLNLTSRYGPWGGTPLSSAPASPQNPKFNPAVKDPLVWTSDDWDFPSGEPLSFATIGRIHRGTPWQTLYLKSADTNGVDWQFWTGDNLIWNTSVADASLSRPVMDRALISLLGPVLSTNDPNRQLSLNNPDTNAWLAALDGLVVQTNSSPATTLVITSNSPQAWVIAQGIIHTRQNTNPAIGPVFRNKVFHSLGDLLATPQLAEQSPFLNTNNLQSLTAGGLSDEVFESLPTQLLPLLREDSFGSLIQTNNQWLVQFTGNDFCTYAVEASSNLVDWTILGTNQPDKGLFQVTVASTSGASAQFFRAVLLP